MFVLHIDANKTWGGGQEQSLGLARALAERGHRIYFVCQQESALAERLRASGLEWTQLPLRGLRGAVAAGRLRKMFGELKPDIVHVHDAASQVPACWAVARAWGMARAPGPRVVITRRNTSPVRYRRGIWKYGHLYDRVICVSEAVKRELARARISAEKLVVIPDFVDCDHFDPRAVPAGRGDGRPTVVTVGRLTAEKGHEVLLRAMAAVSRALPRARLVVCGRGPLEGALRQQAASLGLAEAVSFAGFAPDVRVHLAAADVFAMPSLSEGLGVAALEAMAMGLPVVASDAGGLPESVVDGETGLVAPAGRPEPLAEALLSLLRDPERARAMGRAGQKRARERYHRPRVVDRIVSLYHEALGGG